MQPVLIGSRALQHWKPNLKLKTTTDWDVISSQIHQGCEVHEPNSVLQYKQVVKLDSKQLTH